MESFANRIKALREEQGLTQKYVAEAIQLNQSSYSRIEKGQRLPSSKVIDRLANIYGRSPLDLVRGTESLMRYGKATLSVDELSKEQKRDAQERSAGAYQNMVSKATIAYIFRLMYGEIFNLFNALYGGSMYFEFEKIGIIYDKLKEVTSSILQGLDDSEFAELYIPESIYMRPVPPEMAGEEWEHEIEPQLIEAWRTVRLVTDRYLYAINAEDRGEIEREHPHDEAYIHQLHFERENLERQFFENARNKGV